MTHGIRGKKPTTSRPITSTTSSKVSKTQTPPTTSKTQKTQPKVTQDTTGKAKQGSTEGTKDHLSKMSTTSKMERGKRTTGTKTTKGTTSTKGTGGTKTTSGSKSTTSTKGGGKTRSTGTKPKRGLKYRPKRLNIKAQDEQGQTVQRRTRTAMKKIKTSNQPQGTKEEQLSKLRSKEGKTGGDSVNLKPGRELQMKELGEKYKTGEQDQQPRTVQVNYRDVQVKDKVWQQQENQFGPKTGTKVLSDYERKEAETKFGQKGWDQQGQMNVKLTDGTGSVLGGQKRMFVMDGQSKIHSAKPEFVEARDGTRVDTHHSMFTDGKSVGGAGNLKTREDGTLKKIDDGSGHYKPGAQQTLQTMRELERKGVAMDNVKFEMVRGVDQGPSGEQRTKGMVNEYRQGGGSETTFRGRHEVTNELQEKMKGVRNTLDKQAREMRRDLEKREDKPYQPGPPQPRAPKEKQKFESLGYTNKTEEPKKEKPPTPYVNPDF